jgi:hypothetical protein
MLFTGETGTPARNASRRGAFPFLSDQEEEELMTHFRHAAIAAALLASVGTASAQTTVITREPVQTQTVVTTQPLQLSPVQRQTIYRTIRHAPVQMVEPTVEFRVGMRVPETARLYEVPQDVAVEVPAVRSYRYMMVNDHVVLVDPATSEIVADFAD